MSASDFPHSTAPVDNMIDRLADQVPATREAGPAPPTPALHPAVVGALQAAHAVVLKAVRHYHRLDIALPPDRPDQPDQPVLFVANHGFGGIFDLNVLATFAALEALRLTRPVTALTHQIAWTLRVGTLIEALGARPASRASALESFTGGEHVLVFPGGDLDGGKSFMHRNRIVFGGRRGFARLAVDAGVPIVPIVTAGAGESLFVVSDGRWLASALRLDKTLRMNTLPVSFSLPWGLNVGGVGLLPHLPLPTKLRSTVLAPMWPQPGESVQQFGDRVEHTMQATLTELTRRRRFILG
jgi:1-acyl-sn-glycerol-3-phosphate acyltransferase